RRRRGMPGLAPPGRGTPVAAGGDVRHGADRRRQVRDRRLQRVPGLPARRFHSPHRLEGPGKGAGAPRQALFRRRQPPHHAALGAGRARAGRRGVPLPAVPLGAGCGCRGSALCPRDPGGARSPRDRRRPPHRLPRGPRPLRFMSAALAETLTRRFPGLLHPGIAWLTAAVSLAALPHLLRTPPWIPALYFALIILRLGTRSRRPGLHAAFRLGVGIGIVAGVLFSYG